MNRRTLVIVVVVAAGAIFASRMSVHIGRTAEDKEATQQAIEQFHDRLGMGDFDRIYDDSDVALRITASRETLIAAMRETKGHWGKPMRVTYSYLRVLTDRAPVEVRVVYNTTFEKGDATEMFTFVRRGSKLKLAYYNISPGTSRPNSR